MEQKKTAQSRPLTCWQEIADYLGVNVRTAQKWERERGLPVQRIAGPRGRVSCDVASLDVWKQNITRVGLRDQRYRWPLGPAVTVELSFTGVGLEPTHIEVLSGYLELLKSTLH